MARGDERRSKHH
jgi:hypothetical protein